MTSAEEKHKHAIQLFQAGRVAESLKWIREALGEEDSSERWNDWATLQFLRGQAEEAEAGFRIALEMDRGNTQAALNLGALLQSKKRHEEALPYLERAALSDNPEEKSGADRLLHQIPRAGPAAHIAVELEAYLRRFLSSDKNERSYFETHVRRYVATLTLLPMGANEMRVLELGAAFHHITPALLRRKGYGEVRCNDIWEGAAQQVRKIVSNSGDEEFAFVVDNFDVQASPWPYEDASFDAVLCCEMLEHLHTDPMGVWGEINRILKPDGALLLTTPNLACAHAVEAALKGESPYVYGKFERAGAPTDRHNREYTTGEVERLALAAGFEITALRTQDSWWECPKDLLRRLASQGYAIARRGDNTILLARKKSEVRDRYPEEFYQSAGTQAARRDAQAGISSSDSPADAEYVPPRNVLLIHEVLPHFDCSGSDLRLLEVIREIRRQGHQLTYVARNDRNFDRYAPTLEALGVKVVAGDPDRMKHIGEDRKTPWSFREVLERGRFDAAILFHWFWSGVSVPEDYLHEIRRFSSATRILVISDDRHGERERRMAKLTGALSDSERGNDFEAREAAVYRQSDLVLYISEADKKRFLELCPGIATESLPMQAETVDGSPGFTAREGVLFLGNFENPANRDALEWMLESVWPLALKEEPGLTLYVAGNAAPKDLADRHCNVKCLGRVEDLAPVFAARRVFAAPIRYGTGINTKNLQAMSYGLPVVTTSVGAEGIEAAHGIHALVADGAQGFADNLVRLNRDATLWEAITKGGREIIDRKFSPAQFQSQVRKIISRAASLRMKAATNDGWSYRSVEKTNPEVLTQRPGSYRPMLRMMAYWQAGQKLLTEGDAAQALEQFRHIFAMPRGVVPAVVFYQRLFADMAEAYRKLGDEAAVHRCAEQLRQLRTTSAASLAALVPQRRRTGAGRPSPEISVVIPTCNRKETLRICLAALAFQLLPADRWEIVVVDDGSTDGTEKFVCDYVHPSQNLRFIRQENQGAGAARRAGVEAARGEFVLLLNDDTIASPALLTEHLKAQGEHAGKRVAILGSFRPSEECIHRALSFWVNHSVFFFPQSALKGGELLDHAYFITCNLSMRRDAILEAGNFDAAFRVAEDTELGARLTALGYVVRFHPAAGAWHEHSQFTVNDLLRRARAYGAADWALFRKHPRLLGRGAGPFGLLRDEDFERITTNIEKNREAVAVALTALKKMEELEMLPLFKKRPDGNAPAEGLCRQLSEVVPMVYWQALFESFMAARASADGNAPTVIKAETQLAAVP